MEFLDIALRALAVYRVTHLLIHEEGPFSIAQWLRSVIDPRQTSWIGRGWNCPLCLSFWLALAFAFVPWWVIVWIGLAGLILVARKAYPRLLERD